MNLKQMIAFLAQQLSTDAEYGDDLPILVKIGDDLVKISEVNIEEHLGEMVVTIIPSIYT
jgi:hypothetical protein